MTPAIPDRLSGVVARASATIDRAFETLSSVDSGRWAALFYGGLLVYVARVVAEALGYADRARLFPLVVGSVVLGLLALKLAFVVLPERYTPSVSGVFDSIRAEFDESADEMDEATRYRRAFVTVVWIVALVPVVWLFGFLVALPTFVFAFAYVYERSLGRALFVTVVATALVYGLFVVLLDAQLYRGVLQLSPLGVVA